MSDVAAQLTVVIDAIDNASGVIAGVAAGLGSIDTMGAAAAGSTAAVNNALSGTTRSGAAANTALAGVAASGAKADVALSNTAKNSAKIIATAEQWKQSGKALKEFGEGVDTITKPLQIASVAALGLGIASGKAAIDFEDNFAAVKKTVDGTDEQLESIKQGIIDMTTVGINGHKAIPLTTADLTELAAAGGQLGIQTENILGFTETMAMLGTATNLSGEAGAQTLARFMNVTNTAQSDVDELGSSVVALGNNFATTEAEIANMAMDMGATGTTVGMSTQDILGYATALSSMGIEAAAGGSALQRIWMDMQNAVSGGGKDLQKFAKTSGKTAKEFAKQWEEDATGAFNAFLKGLNESSDQVGLLATLGFENVRDQRALLALAGEKGFGILTDAIGLANKAWEENTALQNEFNDKAETTKSHLLTTKTNIVEAARSFGEVLLPSVADATSGISKFAQGVAAMDDETKRSIINGAAGVIMLGAISKGFVGAVKGAGAMHEAIGKVIENAPKAGSAIATGITSPVGMAGAALLLTGGLWAGIMAQGDKVTDVNETFGESVGSLAKEFQNLNDKIYEDNQKLKEYQEITEKIDSGNLQGDEQTKALERQGELQQWISDNYGNYLSQREQENGITNQSLAAIQRRNELEVERQQLELESGLIGAQQEYENSQQRISEINESLKLNEEYRNSAQQRADACRAYGNALLELENQEKAGIITAQQKKAAIADLRDVYGEYIRDVGADSSDSAFGAAERNQTQANANFAEIVKLTTELNTLRTQQNAAQAAALDLANVYSKTLPEAMERADGSADKMINNLIQTTKGLGVDNEISQQIALVKNGFSDLQEAMDSGDIDAVVSDYVSLGSKFGMTATDITKGAALIKTGFADMESAISAGALETLEAEMNNIAHSLGLIPESKVIRISAEGDISVVDDVKGAVDELNSTGAVQLDVSADGDISLLDTASAKLKELTQNGEVTFTFNTQTQGFDFFDLDGTQLGTIDVDGTIHWKSGEVEKPEDNEADGTINYQTGDVEKPEDTTITGTIIYEAGNTPTFDSLPGFEDVTTTATVNYTIGETPDKAPDIPGTVNYTGDFSGVGDPPPLYGVITYTPKYASNARGTQNFGGGLAMVNDEIGVADNRELVIDKGRAFIPQGRNVLLALSKGAKVYTATQTKRIMAGLGIAQYAGGKDNDDLLGTLAQFGISSVDVNRGDRTSYKFDKFGYIYIGGQDASEAANSEEYGKAVDDWGHYTKTHAVSTSEELLKWIEFSGRFLDNIEDTEDIEEKIFTAARKVSDELNKQSKAYIGDRTALNDWDAYGDSAIDAFDRVRDRNLQDYNDGLITWEEYTDNITGIGSAMYDDRRTQSEKWLNHQEKYNGMSTSSYIDGINRMRDYTQEYYDNGIITYREYIEGMSELDGQYLDKRKEQISEQFDISSDWISEYTYFNDWQDIGDDPLAAYNRVKGRMDEDFANGDLTQKEYDEYMSGLGSRMYSERREQSANWLDEQRKYFGMEADAYAEGLDRQKEYTEEYYRLGMISRREYNEGMTELNHQMWDEASTAYDDMLNKQSDYISDVKEQLSDAEQALRDSWDVEDRKTDMAEIAEQLEIFEGAVTDRGQEHYKDLQEQMLQLQRDEELYNLQVENNAIIENLEAEYEQLEADKVNFLKGIAENTDIDVSGIISSISTAVASPANNISRSLEDIIDAIHGVKMEQQNFYDSRKINITATSSNDYATFMGGS